MRSGGLQRTAWGKVVLALPGLEATRRWRLSGGPGRRRKPTGPGAVPASGAASRGFYCQTSARSAAVGPSAAPGADCRPSPPGQL